MKDSKTYSPKITKLFRTLKKQAAPAAMPVYADPVDAVVYALFSEHITDSLSDRVYQRVQKHFVDVNDLRVSRLEEILDVLNIKSEEIEQSARAVTETLNAIFEKYDRVFLGPLVHDGKRQAHKELSEIPGITPFAVSYCFLTALGGHAVPMTPNMLVYLRAHGLVHPEATDAEIAGFLERQIGASDAYLFYKLVRAESEQPASSSQDSSPGRSSRKAAAKPGAPAASKKAAAGKKKAVPKETKKK